MRGHVYDLTTYIADNTIAYAADQRSQWNALDFLFRHGRAIDLINYNILSGFTDGSNFRQPVLDPNAVVYNNAFASPPTAHTNRSYWKTAWQEWNGSETTLVFWGLCIEKNGTDDLNMTIDIFNHSVVDTSTETPTQQWTKSWTNAEISVWSDVTDGLDGVLTHTMTIDGSIDSLVPSQGADATPNMMRISAKFDRDGTDSLKIAPAYLFVINSATSRS